MAPFKNEKCMVAAGEESKIFIRSTRCTMSALPILFVGTGV
jgi:hypothetical protein